MSASAPVGVFDSGIGGVSVLRHIRQLLPQERLIYCADSAHAPYGSKSPEFIRERSHALTQFLLTQGVKAIVVACNTATAAAIGSLRVRHALPVIGMEPAVKPAVAASRNGVIGVLATIGTLRSAQFAALLESYGRDVRVVTQACPGLVECVERGELAGAETEALVAGYLKPLLAAGADVIVLGCTHYPFLRETISRQLPQGVMLIDTGEAVARQLGRKLGEAGLLNVGSGQNPILTFWINQPTDAAYEQTVGVVGRLWGNAEADFHRLEV
ncbi:MAG TPA: glutamate racemase [Methylophilaceae bacterium]|jgi:glutamate racemase